MYDLVIIGSGPAGLSASLAAKRVGLDYVVLERGIIADTIYHFPIARPLFSTANELELQPGSLPATFRPTREELLKHYMITASQHGLNIRTGENVWKIEPVEDGFVVHASSGGFLTRSVLAALGGFGRERHLEVPGENSSRVSYRFSEPFQYAMKGVLVVGGGNSAAEAALALSEVGAAVTLAVRTPSLDIPVSESTVARAAIKPWVREPLDRAIASGAVQLLTSSEVVRLTADAAFLEVSAEADPTVPDQIVEVPCDHIFALIGADPDTSLLEGAGARIAEDGRPVYDPVTYETTVPGLFIAGHLTRERHIKNAIRNAERVVEYIGEHIGAYSCDGVLVR
jgi:thioredoxin reductase (NADPH)